MSLLVSSFSSVSSRRWIYTHILFLRVLQCVQNTTLLLKFIFHPTFPTTNLPNVSASSSLPSNLPDLHLHPQPSQSIALFLQPSESIAFFHFNHRLTAAGTGRPKATTRADNAASKNRSKTGVLIPISYFHSSESTRRNLPRTTLQILLMSTLQHASKPFNDICLLSTFDSLLTRLTTLEPPQR